jgi:hypothetical protein
MAMHFPPGPEDSSVCVFLSTRAPAAGAGAALAGRWRSITPHGERRSRPGPDRACSENTVLIFQNTILRHENLILAGPSSGTPDGSPRRGQLPRQRRAHPPPRAAGQGGGRTNAPRLQRQRAVRRMTRRLPGSRPERCGSAARQGPGAAWVRREACGGGQGWRPTPATAAFDGASWAPSPGLRPDRSGSLPKHFVQGIPHARQGPGAAWVRREACGGGAGRVEFTILGSLDLLWGHCLDVISDIPVTFRRTSDPKVGRVTPKPGQPLKSGHFRDKASLDLAVMPNSSRGLCTKNAPAYQK